MFNEKPNGNFPVHSPDPLKAKDFISENVDKNSFFTAVFDGDGDRIAFFDGDGELVF